MRAQKLTTSGTAVLDAFRFPVLKKLRDLARGRFARNVAIVASGTAGAQAITVAFAPIITRLYDPEDLGNFGAFTSLAGVLVPVAALTLPTAIVLPRDDDDARGIARLALATAFVVALLLGAILALEGERIAEMLHLEAIGGLLMLMPILMIASAYLQITEQWLIRRHLFAVNAKVAIFQSLLLNGARVVFGITVSTSAVLIVVTVVGSVVQGIVLGFCVNRSIPRETRLWASSSVSLKTIMRRYRDFAIYRAPQVLINASSQSLPVLMLAASFGPASAGYYTLAQSITGIPASLIGKSIGDVFYPRAAKAAAQGESLVTLLWKASLILATVGIVPLVVIVLVAPDLFQLVFGADWTPAGEYARWLSLWMFCNCVNTACIKAIPVIGGQRFDLAFTAVTLLVRLAVLLIVFRAGGSDVTAVAVFGAAGAILNMMLFAIVLLKTRTFDKLNGVAGEA